MSGARRKTLAVIGVGEEHAEHVFSVIPLPLSGIFVPSIA